MENRIVYEKHNSIGTLTPLEIDILKSACNALFNIYNQTNDIPSDARYILIPFNTGLSMAMDKIIYDRELMSLYIEYPYMATEESEVETKTILL